jgi:hypothetical protein
MKEILKKYQLAYNIDYNIKNESNTDIKLKTKTNTKNESNTDIKLETKTNTKNESNTDIKLKTKTNTKNESNTDIKLKTKTNTKNESNTDIKLETKTNTKNESNTDIKLETKTNIKTESNNLLEKIRKRRNTSTVFSYVNRETYIKSFITVLNNYKKKNNIKDPVYVKHSVSDYLNGIIDVIQTTHSWRQYIGPIDGRVLNNQFHKYIKMNLFESTYQFILNKYFSYNKPKKTKRLSIDSTFARSKGLINGGYSKFHDRKKGLKLSGISDSNNVMLSLSVYRGNINDNITIKPSFDKQLINPCTYKYRKTNRYKQTILADAGYHSKENIKYLKKKGFNVLIPINPRNTKDTKKLELIKKHNEKIYNSETYKKRSGIENQFSKLKAYPKLASVYEKNISSYLSLSYITFSFLTMN